MWDSKKSLALSKCCVVVFMVALAVAAIITPWAFNHSPYFQSMHILRELGAKPFLVTVYSGFVPAAALLAFLFILLHRIGKEQVFITENVRTLRQISWCCFVGAMICFASSIYWFPWFAIGVAAAFMGLIVRVVKNVIAKAVSLQEEADYTI